MTVPAQIIQAAKRYDLVLLIGMDLPEKATAILPSTQLAQSTNVQTSSLVTVMQGITPRWRRNKFLKEHYTVAQPSSFYASIATLPVWHYMTSCYDDSLKLALINNGRSVHELITDADLDAIDFGSNKPQLIKLCGSLNERSTLVRTSAEFTQMPSQNQRKLYEKKVGAWLATKTFVLLGCDPTVGGDFDRWQHRFLLNRQGGFAKQSYLVWPNSQQVDRAHWADQEKNVGFIDAAPTEFLIELDATLTAAAIEPPTADIRATKRLLQILAGSPDKQVVTTAVQAITTTRPLQLIRPTLSFWLSGQDTLMTRLSVDYEPDIQSFDEQDRNTGITLAQLTAWAKKADKRRRRNEDPKGTDVEDNGRAFFEQIFPAASPARAAYQQARNYYHHFGEALELEIDLTLDERLKLWAMPWELLHDGELSLEDNSPSLGFLGLSTPVYRRIKMKSAPEQLTQPITKALIIAADPRDTLTELDKELTWLHGELVKHGITVDVCQPDEALIDDPAKVLAKILNGRYQLLHFIGHGQFNLAEPANSGLLLGRPGVEDKQLSATILAQAAKESRLTMVFVSACFGAKDAAIDEERPWEVAGILTGLLRAGVPAAVGMRWKVGDSASRQLAEQYYANLFGNMPLEKALQRARLGLLANNKVDWANPIISKRRDVRFSPHNAAND